MNVKTAVTASLIFAILFSGCSNVSCKKPVGERVPELESKDWNGTWIGEAGIIIETKIKSLELGIVEVTYIKFPQNPKAEAKPFDAIIREVTGNIVASAKGSKNPGDSYDQTYSFCRVAINHDHLVIYDLNQSTFDSMTKQGLLSGEQIEDKDKDEKPTGLGHHTVLNSLSEKDIDNLKQFAEKNPSFRIDDLFKHDPFWVFIRSN